MDYFDAQSLLTHYCDRLEKDKVGFLKSKKKVRDNLEELIKELKQYLSRGQLNKQLETAGIIWKLLMANALEQISFSKSIRGLGALYEYYNHFVEFENVLFGVDPTYRDHTMHILWVYLLGDYILNQQLSKEECHIDWGIQLLSPAGNDKGNDYKKDIEKNLNKDKDAVYCIIALSHDLAYPFERTVRINKRLENLIGYIGIQSFERLQYNFSQEQSQLIHELLEFVSTKAIINSIENSPQIKFVKDNPTFIDMSQSFEQHKHGILSSYLLYRLIDTMGEATFTEIESLPDSKNKAINLILRKTILYAIASHTCDYAYSYEYNNFRFLLSLVDELEEFSRYKRQGRDGVDEICKSGLEFVGPGQLSIEYRFEDQHAAEPKTFFINRAVRFCSMVDASRDRIRNGGIKELILKCVDAKKSTSNTTEYSLKINEKGIFCKKPSSKRWLPVHPDPETDIRRMFK